MLIFAMCGTAAIVTGITGFIEFRRRQRRKKRRMERKQRHLAQAAQWQAMLESSKLHVGEAPPIPDQLAA